MVIGKNLERVRKRGQSMETFLNNREVGDPGFFDEETEFWIYHVPGGLIYKNEYAGCVFVPYESKKTMAEKKVEKPATKITTK